MNIAPGEYDMKSVVLLSLNVDCEDDKMVGL